MQMTGAAQVIVCKDIARWLTAKQATVAADRVPPYHARLSNKPSQKGPIK
jgi:hypothetical protein